MSWVTRREEGELELYDAVTQALSLDGRTNILSEFAWKGRAVQHPYPHVDRSRHSSEKVIMAEVRNTALPHCWVDLATGEKFTGAFPMEAHTIRKPNEAKQDEWLCSYLPFLEAEMRHILEWAAGPSGMREFPCIFAYPIFEKQARGVCPILVCVKVYGAFEGENDRFYQSFATVK